MWGSLCRLSRRRMIAAGALAAVGSARAIALGAEAGSDEEATPPAEDLMREHGVLRRALLLYDEAARTLGGATAFPLDVVTETAALIRRFVEGYHEHVEEELIFPRFDKAGVLVDLTMVLRRQHNAGRAVTERITALAAGADADSERRARLADAMVSFARMYRPHAAREDTVLFPALRRLLSEKDYAALGKQMDEMEKTLVGEGGFEKAVEEVAALEKRAGIYELQKFTPLSSGRP